MEKWGLRFGKIVYKVKPEDRIQTWRILTGDIVLWIFYIMVVINCWQVKVISGEFQGQEGRVISVLRKQNKVLIEGINTVSSSQMRIINCIRCPRNRMERRFRQSREYPLSGQLFWILSKSIRCKSIKFTNQTFLGSRQKLIGHGERMEKVAMNISEYLSAPEQKYPSLLPLPVSERVFCIIL